VEVAPIAERWSVLLVLFVSRTVMAFQFQTIGALGPVLMERTGIGFGRLGVLVGLYMLPGIGFALLGGFLGRRYRAKKLLVGALLLMASGGVLTASPSLGFTEAGRLVSGSGGVLANVIMTKAATDWFAGREIVTAMSVFVASWPLGLALGLVSLPPIAAALSWQAAIYASVLAACACIVVVALCYRDPPGAGVAAPAALAAPMPGRERILASLAGLTWSAYNVGYIVLVSFLPEIFTARGYSLAQAGQIVSLLGWILIPSVPLSGLVAERLHRPDGFILAGFAIVAVAAAALPFADNPMLFFLPLVIGIGMPAGLVMALPEQVVSAEHRAVGMGIFYTFYYAGMAVVPPLAGLASELSVSPAVTPLVAAALMGLAAAALLTLRMLSRRTSGG
jgi:predicted MFS family arabinose efflux permease